MNGTTAGRPGRRLVMALAAGTSMLAAMAPTAAAGATGDPVAKGGVVTRASVATGGAQARGGSATPVRAGLSADGNRVVFESGAPDLVRGDTNKVDDVFVHDLASGRTTRLSVSSTGKQANDGAVNPALSADGRHATFESFATNLAAGPGKGKDEHVDVFLRDIDAKRTRVVSVGYQGRRQNGDSFFASPSRNGKYVAFQSTASNLVKRDRNGMEDVFLRNMKTGRTTLVSTTPKGRQFRNASIEPSISANGRKVLFATIAVDGYTDLYVWDRRTATSKRVFTAARPHDALAMASSWRISGNGRYVALMTDYPMVAGDTNNDFDAYRITVANGAVVRASVTSDGLEKRGVTGRVAISGDGNRVAFSTDAKGYVADDFDAWADVFVRDIAAASTFRVSVDPTGAPADWHSGFQGYLALSSDGSAVSFESGATNLVDGDTNDGPDAFVWRAVTG
jgi:Tol biopolymer transport system component